MSVLVECPICKNRKVKKNASKYFVCCKLLHTVKDHQIGQSTRLQKENTPKQISEQPIVNGDSVECEVENNSIEVEIE